MVDYLEQHGGIFMGMIRFDQHSGLYANSEAVDDLYGLRYTMKLLEMDRVDRALVSFYGKLAQGLTRNTFVGAEGTGLRPADAYGRPMYLPPNSASTAFYLWTLRHLLVQDWDLDNDGTPDTLRLAFATPRAWLEDGKRIDVKNAPTAFGPVSYSINSRVATYRIEAEINLPDWREPVSTRFRIRVPAGTSIKAVTANGKKVGYDQDGTIDLSGLGAKISLIVRTSPARRKS
jgi:hypothetical protein